MANTTLRHILQTKGVRILIEVILGEAFPKFVVNILMVTPNLP
jgi:hypothetical protein